MTAPPMARLDICLNFVTGYVHTKGLVVELNLKKIWWNYFKVSSTPGWSKLRDLARSLAENLYERPVLGPRCGPNLCDACFQDVVLHRPGINILFSTVPGYDEPLLVVAFLSPSVAVTASGDAAFRD